MNWKKALGILLMVGAVIEAFNTFIDVVNAKYEHWPWGAETGFILTVIAGVLLIRNTKSN